LIDMVRDLRERENMISRERVLEIFRETGVLMEGHFLLTSGRHSEKYLQCAKVFQYPGYSEELTQALAESFKDDKIDLVIGPAVGGIILSYEMGRCLGVRTVFAERENGRMALRRGFEIPEDSRVLIVEDVITTGNSVREVMDLVKAHRAQVVGVGAFVDRSSGGVEFGVKFSAVITLDIKSYNSDQCPICITGKPLVKPGSRNLPRH
jgi:orotate phosphoribosyltransferase